MNRQQVEDEWWAAHELARQQTSRQELWMTIRHALLMVVGAVERELDIEPTTKECREMAKAHRKES